MLYKILRRPSEAAPETNKSDTSPVGITVVEILAIIISLGGVAGGMLFIGADIFGRIYLLMIRIG